MFHGLVAAFQTSSSSHSFLCIIVVAEWMDEDEWKTLLEYPIILYWIAASPFDQTPFLSLPQLAKKPMISEKIPSDLVCQISQQLQELNFIRMMMADRFVITKYCSQSSIEGNLPLQENENMSICIILENIVNLYRRIMIITV